MDADVARTVQALDDVSLALLTCLVAQQHLIMRAPEASLAELERRILDVAQSTFDFSTASIICSSSTTVNELSEAAVVSDADEARDRLDLDTRPMANVVVARHLDVCAYDVQIQALEMMRQKRVHSHTAIHAAPRDFLFVALLPMEAAGPDRQLNRHINDHFFLRHDHSDDDMDSTSLSPSSSSSSMASVAKSRPHISAKTLQELQEARRRVRTTAEMRRYAHDVATHLRLHRGVAGGVSALAARGLDELPRVLALLSGLAFVAPAFVALAARKALPHRLALCCTAKDERSVQWGSDAGAVAAALQGLDSVGIVDEVLEAVPCPL